VSRVFLTGGGGYIGGQLADALLARGDEVIALARSDESARALAARSVTIVRGDVCDLDTFAGALGGCDIVHHVAGINAHCPRDPERMWQVNVLGPQNVVHAAARGGVGRVVFTSSSATIGEAHGTVGSEATPHRGSFLSSYERSKHDGERAAFAAASVTGVEAVALNPTSVQGPPRAGGTAAIILAYLKGSLRAFVETHVSVVDVRDVVTAHLLAESRGRPSGRYVLSDEALTSRQAIALLAELSGEQHRVRFVPREVAWRAARAGDLAFRVRGRVSPMCPARVATILHGHRYDGSLAERELGLRYTPLAETFGRTIEWAREQGLVPSH
jgi:dihydroflavonol-4-reductase